MDAGGAETFLMKIYRSLDHEKYQMDFCVSTKKKGIYDEEIKKLGGKIYHIPMKSRHPFKSFNAIKKITNDNNYNYVLRTSQQSLATLDLLAAKIGGAKKIIYRSSNAGLTGGFMSKLINKIFFIFPRIIPNVKIAPSTEAAEYVFGRNSVKKGKVIILPNGLDYDKFRFNSKIRNKIRKELNISSKTILYGHIGRFNIQKNHVFLLDVFKKIHDKNSDSKLLLIGNGELEATIKSKINDLNIKNSIIMLNVRNNVNEYLMAMDLMIFPSLFEGMPNVIIEAQATGLKCIVSDTITKEANITGSVDYVSLNSKADNWAKKALSVPKNKRYNTYTSFEKNGYLIADVTKKFIKIIYEK